jgi:hypothetical protein
MQDFSWSVLVFAGILVALAAGFGRSVRQDATDRAEAGSSRQHAPPAAARTARVRAPVGRRPHRRRLASTDVVYVTASGATLIAAAPSGRPVRRLRSTVAWRPAVTG